ncbi:MAG: hypothetical protein KatS3mg132_558 [Limisphaera sp.]|nr:MAG: hypothetical protein KatS3mg132_558 [Limisphaera sp.]
MNALPAIRLTLAALATAAPAAPPAFTIRNGCVHIDRVGPRNPVVYDND